MNRKTGMRLAAAAGLGAAAFSLAAPALATTKHVGGGTWDYGRNSSITWSHYYHGKACHGSTAVGESTYRTPDTPGGKWARAVVKAAQSGNKAYWRNTC